MAQTKKNVSGMNMIRILDMMYRVDHLFRSQPKRRFTLNQVAGMLGITTRSVERLYDTMKVFGAPIDTVCNSKGRREAGKTYKGTNYGRKHVKAGIHPYVFRPDYLTVQKAMSKYRLRLDQIKAMREAKKLRSIKSCLTKEED